MTPRTLQPLAESPISLGDVPGLMTLEGYENAGP